ncbi:MAG TPA: hypothetical protein VLZ77_05720 [Acidimicrobiales bacterium]|nr:hypothetical protein [Acidimicrobiales bacterium]
MPGEPLPGPTEERAPGPSWLRTGYLVAVAELLLLTLLVLHPAPVQAGPTTRALVTAAGNPKRLAPPTTTSTVPPSTTTTAPTPTTTAPAAPPTTRPPAPARAPAPRPAPTRGLVPPAVPAANIAPQPNFLQSCSGTQYDDSAGCVGAALAAIAHGRAAEGLGPMVLPSNWSGLTPQEQVFVSTNLERTARGLPALSAMASALDQAAQAGADRATDPSPPSGFPMREYGSNWAGAVGNPLEALYYWMYDDGMGSANVDCAPGNQSGCWGHRKNVLLALPCRDCLMGTGFAAGGYKGYPSLAELLVETSGAPAVDFTWQQESAYLS